MIKELILIWRKLKCFEKEKYHVFVYFGILFFSFQWKKMIIDNY